MKKTILAIIFVLFASNVQASGWTGNVNFFLGQKALEKDDWEPTEKQVEFGALFDFKQTSWPVSIAIDVLGSVDKKTVSGLDLESKTSEFDVGIRKVWEIAGGSVRPYIGGGIAFITADLEAASGFLSVSDDDSGSGIWLNAGVYKTIGQHFNLGLEARYSKAKVTLFGVDAEAGGTHGGVILGYHW